MFFIVTPGPAELARLADLADNGKLRTAVSQTFPLRVREGRDDQGEITTAVSTADA
jgi:hypothetical protein